MSGKGVLILHAYSADNAGDGLLVRETVQLAREALGDIPITLVASQPHTFDNLDLTSLPSVPSRRGWDRRTRQTLSHINDFDVVIAVGGGYLRAGTAIEAIKSALVHGPQLRAASKAHVPTVYLPQSIGPIRFGLRRWVRRRLARIDHVLVRDDRSAVEFDGSTTRRSPDLAAAAVVTGRRPGAAVNKVPVLSIRAVHGRVSPDVFRLASALGTYDGYVQSIVSSNDDRPAAAMLSPRRNIERPELLAKNGDVRVVVAVRLHAALMALSAGHYVVHLAYERKGFGAFNDLQLSPWVHNVNSFDPIHVVEQVNALLNDPPARDDYDQRIERAGSGIAAERREIIGLIRHLGMDE